MTRFAWLTVAALAIPGTASAEWKFAMFLGGAHTVTGSLILEQPDRGTHLTLAPISYETRALKHPFYYGSRLAYYFGETSPWGIEGELIHLKIFARTDREVVADGTLNGRMRSGPVVAHEIVSNFAMSHGLNLTLLNIIYRTLPQRQDGRVRRVVLLGRLGGGPTIPHVESHILGAGRQSYQLGRLGLQAAGGIEVQVATRLAVAVDYKLTYTGQRVEVVNGYVSARLLTHHGVVGLVYRL